MPRKKTDPNAPALSPPVIYIAGPFRAPTPWQIELNVRRAEEVALLVAKAGGVPLCPHLIGRHFHGEPLGTPDDGQWWVEATLELLRRCDGAIFIDGWEASMGSIGEWNEAARMKLTRATFNERESRESTLALLVAAADARRCAR